MKGPWTAPYRPEVKYANCYPESHPCHFDCGSVYFVTRSSAFPEGPAVIKQLERFLASRDLEASSRGRALLRFMLGETLANRQERLSLAAIARGVFRRGEDFDPRLDPAVRIEVARLGRALDRYYRLAGAEDPVSITLTRSAPVLIARWASGRARHTPESWDLSRRLPLAP
jgi:hypothetical protein